MSSLKAAEDLPDYFAGQDAFHRAFERELTAAIALCPPAPGMRVLDLACGDGFYTERLAAAVGDRGVVVGSDISPAYLELAQQRLRRPLERKQVELVEAGIDALPFAPASFDFVWCAESFFSLPDPTAALKRMWEVTRPGGMVAVLENDTAHQLLLPWPIEIELALRMAELKALADESRNPRKYYVGRRLWGLLPAAGWTPLGLKTLTFERQAPFDAPALKFLASYLQKLAERTAPYLDDAVRERFLPLVEPRSETFLLAEPYLNFTVLSVLVWGRKE